MNKTQFANELARAGLDIKPSDVEMLGHFSPTVLGWPDRNAKFPTVRLGHHRLRLWYDDTPPFDEDEAAATAEPNGEYHDGENRWIFDIPERLGGYGEEAYRTAEEALIAIDAWAQQIAEWDKDQ